MPVEKNLPPTQFNNVVRWIKQTEVDRLKGLTVATAATIARLHVRSVRMRNAIKGVPEGSDHFDSGSLVEWMNKVQPEDQEAVAQVLAIDATARARLGG